MVVVTQRLELVPATPHLVRAELQSRTALGDVLRIDVPESWPPELYDRAATQYTLERLEEGPDQAGWWLHYVILKGTSSSSPTMVGACGYRGAPSPEGTVEIGYAILREFRRRGYAKEAAQGLIATAFTYPMVTRIIAETLPELAPSLGVLRTAGFRFVGEGSEAGVIRFELTRAEFISRGINGGYL